MFVDVGPPPSAGHAHSPCAPAAASPLPPLRPLPHPSAFTLCGSSQSSGRQVASRLSPFPARGLFCSRSQVQPSAPQSRCSCAPLPARNTDRRLLPAADPCSRGRSTAVLAPRILALFPPALLWAGPRLETADSRPGTECTHRPRGPLCMYARRRHPSPLPDSSFHSPSYPCLSCPQHTQHLGNTYAPELPGFPPELAGVWLRELNFLPRIPSLWPRAPQPRLLQCPRLAALTVASCPA